MSAADDRAPAVALRPVEEDDRLAYFAFQQDLTACAMAAFPPRDQAAFDRHWEVVRSPTHGVTRTAVLGGEVAGIVTSWGDDTQREIAYWFERQSWGRGVATAAVRLFLQEEQVRPLTGRVAQHNVASRRVLEKLGFRHAGVEVEPDVTLDVLVLDAGAATAPS